MTDYPAYYALPAPEREHIERCLYHIVYVVYAGDLDTVKAFVIYAATLAERTNNALIADIAALTLDMITPESEAESW